MNPAYGPAAEANKSRLNVTFEPDGSGSVSLAIVCTPLAVMKNAANDAAPPLIALSK